LSNSNDSTNPWGLLPICFQGANSLTDCLSCLIRKNPRIRTTRIPSILVRIVKVDGRIRLGPRCPWYLALHRSDSSGTMTQSPTDLGFTNADSNDEDLDCSSIQLDQPDQLAELNARYDEVLNQIDALDLRIERLLNDISSEKGTKFLTAGLPR